MFKLNNEKPITRKEIEKTKQTECVTRQMTEEEKEKYRSIKPIDKQARNEFYAHLKSNGKGLR